ncbi:MAG: zinc protease [Acidobacteriota bacterium]|nr:zinc protease [Acidobacteriota bacterium]
MNILQTLLRPFATKLLAFAAALAFACQATLPARAQSPAPEPRREQLLNGLRLLIVPRANDAKIWMKLRIHSGAAFDLANKEGTMALLADALFPDPSTAQYVAEELGGQLDVRTTYDSIDVTLSGNAPEFDRLAELLRNAVLQMRLAPEDIQRLRAARLKSASEARQIPAQIANTAVRARLYGTYPYGRAVAGTPESLARIGRGDLLFARDRFLSPNNSTLIIVGGVDPARVMRTFRQFLGPWRKTESTPPATFKQPDAPDARTLIIAAPGARAAEVRIAARGVARSDRDRAAATLLAYVARQRLFDATRETQLSNLFVINETHALAGVFEVGATAPASASASIVESARAVLRALATSLPSAGETESARRAALNPDEIHRANQYPFADVWLNSITYNYDASTDARALSEVTPADIQRVAARLFRDGQLATIVVGDAAELRAALANIQGGIEVAGAQVTTPPATQQPSQPATRRP